MGRMSDEEREVADDLEIERREKLQELGERVLEILGNPPDMARSAEGYVWGQAGIVAAARDLGLLKDEQGPSKEDTPIPKPDDHGPWGAGFSRNH